MFRYVDDLIAFTTNSNDIQIKTDFYPFYFNLIATNINSLKSNFLDLNINIINAKILTTIFDKRNTYNFSVIKIIH